MGGGGPPTSSYLSLLLQGPEAATGGGQQRLQLQLQGVQLLNADAIVLRAAEHRRVAGAHFDVLDGLEVVVFEWGAVLQLTHGAVRQTPGSVCGAGGGALVQEGVGSGQ